MLTDNNDILKKYTVKGNYYIFFADAPAIFLSKKSRWSNAFNCYGITSTLLYIATRNCLIP
jgi:hypothetical protein